MLPVSLAEALNRKRVALSDYIAAGDDVLRALGDSANPPPTDEIAPLLNRRDAVVQELKKLDKSLTEAEPGDPAAEIVAEGALRRTLQAAARVDAAVGISLAAWKSRMADAIGELAHGRKTLRGYATQRSERSPVVNEAA